MLKECMSERMSLRLVFVEVGGLNPPPSPPELGPRLLAFRPDAFCSAHCGH